MRHFQKYVNIGTISNGLKLDLSIGACSNVGLKCWIITEYCCLNEENTRICLAQQYGSIL